MSIVPTSQSPISQTARYAGEVVYLYAFDIAYDMVRRPVKQLLGQPVTEYSLGSSKRSPRQFLFYRPQMVRLPSVERVSNEGAVRLERSVKLLGVGALSVMVRVPFQVDRLEDLVPYHDLRFSDGQSLHDEVRALANDARNELGSLCIGPHEQIRDDEAYTVFCFHSPLHGGESAHASAEQWFNAHRRQVAALLTEEPDANRLAEQEALESTSKYLSYYDRDLVVIDWDAALVADEPRYFDEMLFLMELANLQLVELEAYDRILDAAVERSYRDLSRKRVKGWQATGVQRELREIRIDLARLSDELLNITKFFGDWHYARIYQELATRFHLADWHRTIDEKLKTLDEMYGLLRAEQNNRWMLILEASIVLLFIVDLILLGMTAN